MSRSHSQFILAPLILASLALGCAEAVAPLPRCSVEQSETVDVAVSPGLEPEFSWLPQCGVDQVIVTYPDPSYPLGSGEPAPMLTAWIRLSALGTPGVPPPLRYGAPPPAGLPELFPAVPLQRGRKYIVTLLMEPGFLIPPVQIARAEFTP